MLTKVKRLPALEIHQNQIYPISIYICSVYPQTWSYWEIEWIILTTVSFITFCEMFGSYTLYLFNFKLKSCHLLQDEGDHCLPARNSDWWLHCVQDGEKTTAAHGDDQQQVSQRFPVAWFRWPVVVKPTAAKQSADKRWWWQWQGEQSQWLLLFCVSIPNACDNFSSFQQFCTYV